MRKRYIIIGNSAAGVAAVEKIKELDAESEIICISKEKEYPYNKCKLAYYLAGKKDERSVFLDVLKNESVTMLLGRTVEKVLSDNKQILLKNGETVVYDELLIATGAHPIRPKIRGTEIASGIFTFHTLQDTNDILDFIKKQHPKHAVVIGSGMTGLEVADALSSLGINVTVVEKNNRVLCNQSDEYGSNVIEKAMEKKKVQFLLNYVVKEIVSENGMVKQIILNDEKIIPAHMVVCALGVAPTIGLLKNLGIETEKCGIVTDEYMRTNKEHIYAGGDVACVKDFMSGKNMRNSTWSDACAQGVVAAHAMVGKPIKYAGALPIAFSKFFGIKFASCGQFADNLEEYEQMVKKGDGFYNKIVLKNGRVIGFILIGNTDSFSFLRDVLKKKEKVSRGQLSF